MNIKTYSKKEMLLIEQQEEGMPLRKRWYKEIGKEIYQYQLDIMKLSKFEEVLQ